MINLTSFEQESIAVVSRFLQSVIVFDDQAYPDDQSEGPHEKIEPGASYDLSESVDKELLPSVITSATHGNNPIDTKIVVNAFAERGIVCAVIDPPLDPETSKLGSIFHKADIGIVDWYIDDVTGEYSTALIRRFIKDVVAVHSHQFHLILIYTTEQDLQEVADKLKTMLYALGGRYPS